MWTRSLRNAICPLLLSGLVAAGCAGIDPEGDEEREMQSPAFAPAAVVTDSFQLVDQKRLVRIKRSALDKEFLLQTSLVTQEWASMFNGMRSRIVYFKIMDTGSKQELVLFETGKDYAAMPHDFANPAYKIASFPIVAARTDESWVCFNFNLGMKEVFAAYDWFASDMEYVGPDPSTWYTMPLEDPYFDPDFPPTFKANNLVLRQIVRSQPGNVWMPPSWTVKLAYYLTPYLPSPSFQPMSSLGFNPGNPGHLKVGFFESTPRFVQGKLKVYTSRFPKPTTTRPITFTVSANTPDEYKQAVRDGVLYWNSVFKKVFGQEGLVQVKDGPAGVYAPDPEHNMVQWYDAPDMGFAYADGQLDPRTGELLHGNVFMSSTFAVYSLDDARARIRRFETTARTRTKAGPGQKLTKAELMKSKMVGMPEAVVDANQTGVSKGLQVRPRDLKGFQTFLGAMRAAVRSAGTDAQVLAMAQDVVREVVAHEVGHVLGLRHNFAGSAGGNRSLSEVDGVFKSYVESLKPGATLLDLAAVEPSSSIMDYHDGIESMLSGRKVQQGQVLLHDFYAIKVLYRDGKIQAQDKDKIPPFCSDLDYWFDRYWDCMPFDRGSSVADYVQWNKQDVLSGLPHFLLEGYIADKTNSDVFPVDVKTAKLWPEDYAYWLTYPMEGFLRLFTKEGRTVRVLSKYKYSTSVNPTDVSKKQWLQLKKEIAAVTGTSDLNAGVAQLLALLPAGYASDAAAKFEALLDAVPASGIVGHDGQVAKFTQAERAAMKKNARGFFNLFEQKVLGQANESFMVMPSFWQLLGAEWYGDPVGTTLPNISSAALAGALAQALQAHLDDVLFTVAPVDGKVYPLPAGYNGCTDEATQQVYACIRDAKITLMKLGPDNQPIMDPAGKPETFTKKVNLPVYLAGSATRMGAAALFMGMTAEAQAAWGVKEQKALAQKFDDALKALLGIGYTFQIKFDNIADYPDARVYQWLQDWQGVQGTLGFFSEPPPFIPPVGGEEPPADEGEGPTPE